MIGPSLDDSFDPLGSQLIFVISQPRSGSTLLQSILGSHSEIHTLPEPWVMLPLVYGFRSEGIRAEYDARLGHEALVQFLEQGSGRSACIDAIRAAASSLYGNVLRDSSKRFFLDKTPRYYLIVEDLLEIFPSARFVFLVRNPLGVLASVISSHLHGDISRLGNSDRKLDLEVAPRAIAAASTDVKHRCLIRYEDLVTDPEGTARLLCERVGLPFDDGMLAAPAAKSLTGRRFGDQRSVHLHEGAVSDFLNRWREVIADDRSKELAHGYLDSLGTDLLNRLGYDIESLRTDLGPRPRGRLLTWNELIADPAHMGVRHRLRLLSRGGKDFRPPSFRKLIRFLFGTWAPGSSPKGRS